MTQSLSWNLYGNDQLSGVLEKLDRSVSQLSRSMDRGSTQAREYGRAMGTAETASVRMHSTTLESGRHFDLLNEKVAAVASMLRTVAITAGVALAGAAAAAGAFGIKMAAANEDAAISFELMLGSAQKAQVFLAQLQQFAAATPFEMPQLRSAASRLLAVGINAERVIPILTVLGDATAGMGTGAEGIERSVTALTQMQQKTKVTGEEMMQLTEAGIPAWETLAAKLGVDVATAMQKVTAREVDAGVIFDAVQQRQGAGLQRLTNMMQKQSQTLNGIWSTFKDNAGQALATFMQPFIPSVKAAIDWAAENLPKFLTGFQAMARQVGGIFAGSDVPEKVMAALRTLGREVLPVLKQSWDSIVKTVSDNKEGLEKLGRFVAEVLIPVVGTTLVMTLRTLTVTIDAVVWALGHIVDAAQFMTTKTLAVLGTLVHGAAEAFGWIPGLGPQLREAADKFDEFTRRVKAAQDQINTPVNVTVTAQSIVGGKMQKFAEGGLVEGPYGSPQVILAHAGERVLTSAQQRGSDYVGVLRVVHETPDGHVLREELLALKRQRNLASLGF